MTNGSASIGSAIVKDLFKTGVRVVVLARRKERVEKIKNRTAIITHCHVMWCFQSVIGELVLMDVQDIQNVLQTNAMGIVYCTQRAFKSMKERNIDGHVVLINNLTGHKVLIGAERFVPVTNIYSPSKFSVTALTEIYRQEFKGFLFFFFLNLH